MFNIPMNTHQKLRAAFLKSAMEVVDETRRTQGFKTPKVTYQPIPGLPSWLGNSNRVNPEKPEDSVGGAGDTVWTGRTVTGTGAGPVIGDDNRGSAFQ